MNITEPALLTDDPMVIEKSASTPTIDDFGGVLRVGQELLRLDTGARAYWDGTTWKAVTETQKLCQLVDILREIKHLLTN